MKILEDMKIRPVGWVKAGIYALVLGLVYYTAFTYLLHLWENEDFSYGYLVPFFVVFLIWEKRKRLAVIPSDPSWKGLILFAVGILLYALGELGGEYSTLYISFWLIIASLVWLHLGWRKVRTIWFALAMIVAMFPPPNVICVQISLGLKLVSSQLGVWMLHLTGMSAFREGNVIDLGFTQLQVVDACSGLRYLVPLMVLSLLLAHWFMEHFWKRLVLFASAVPLAVFINSFRIAMTGILYRIAGQQVAEGFFHGFAGGLIFVVALPVLFVVVWLLKMLPPRERGFRLQVADVTPEMLELRKNAKPAEPKGFMGDLLQSRFVIAVVVILTVFAATHAFEFREKIPARESFSQFPMVVGEWSGTKQAMDQQFIDALKFSDHISANFYDRQGKTVNLYVAYYEDQRKGESIHSPESCLPSSGWNFREAGAVSIPGASGKTPMKASRALMEKGGLTEMSYYWFPMRGKILTRLYEIKLHNFWDALIRRRTDGALVMTITPIYPAETQKDADQRLQRFVTDMKPVLDEFLPE
ncbi:MAG: Transmembrane exosortase (Exosortase_EpsH) [Syntrophorhabdaceae bacterium PtaU1.Bin034]|nr:MAG: Transmembrane exosortase (Exosortase_EpsH) [Syntrophorhabdaceae bacterium PtaU1.Bin034]